jgi:hypothetical protein
VNLSSFKLGVYDFLGFVVPGIFVICEGWIAVRGWPRFVEALSVLRPVSFTVFLAGSFVIGHFVQEMADWGVKRIKGPRFFKKGRDEVWGGVDGDAVKSAIWAESGLTLASVDSAFDYCLTRVGEAFSKRDVFIATSDFARSFLVLAVCGIAPSWRLASDRTYSISAFVLLLAAYVVLLILIAQLSWRRMVRFRYISDCGVFGAYLGSRPAKNIPTGRGASRTNRSQTDSQE